MYDNLVLYDIVGGGRWRSGFSGVLVMFWRRGLAGCHVLAVNWNFLDFGLVRVIEDHSVLGSECELKVKLVGAVHYSERGLRYGMMARVLRGTLFYHTWEGFWTV